MNPDTHNTSVARSARLLPNLGANATIADHSASQRSHALSQRFHGASILDSLRSPHCTEPPRFVERSLCLRQLGKEGKVFGATLAGTVGWGLGGLHASVPDWGAGDSGCS